MDIRNGSYTEEVILQQLREQVFYFDSTTQQNSKIAKNGSYTEEVMGQNR